MPILRVEMFKGRTTEQKRALARELTDAFVKVTNSKPESIWIVFQDVGKEDWAAGGALMADKYPD